MVTERERGSIAPILVAATPLTWPALWNGYPLVFSDTGTYLSQAVEHYVGWDRPPFYSLFLLPLHMTLTTWPIVAAQALLAAHTLHLARRAAYPGATAWWVVPLTIMLAITSSLPWFVAQIMPDLFTGLLVLTLSLLIFASDQLSRRERFWLVTFSAFMIAVHRSHVLLAILLLAVLLPLRRWLGAKTQPANGRHLALSTAPLMLAATGLVLMNLTAFSLVSLAPFGNVFLLARVIYDGPGRDVLRQECPAAGWRLCAFADQLPPTSDEFLWRHDGPVVRAGGAKLVSAEANAIIGEAFRREPAREVGETLRDFLQQLGSFATGDGLGSWPDTVTPWIRREFPASEAAAYAASYQARGMLSVPQWFKTMQAAIAAGSAAALPLLLCQRRFIRGIAAAALLAILANAAITGTLSSPHDRYQSRIMWLPSAVVLLATGRFVIR